MIRGFTTVLLAMGIASSMLASLHAQTASQPQTASTARSTAGKYERVTVLPVVNGKRVPETIAAWAASAPLSMVHQYIPALRSFDAIAFDSGDRDAGIADTVKTLDQVLTGYGITHTAEIYDGDHLNRIEQRLETKVLPFFAKHLKANPTS